MLWGRKRPLPTGEDIAHDVYSAASGNTPVVGREDVERYLIAIMDGTVDGTYPNIYHAGRHPNLPAWVVDAAFGRSVEGAPPKLQTQARKLWGNNQLIEGLAANEHLTDGDYRALAHTGIGPIHWHLRRNPSIPDDCVSVLMDSLISQYSLCFPQMESTVRGYVNLAQHPSLPLTGAASLLAHLMYCVNRPNPFYDQLAVVSEPLLDGGWKWERLLTNDERSALIIVVALS